MTKTKVLLLGSGGVVDNLAHWFSDHGENSIRYPLHGRLINFDELHDVQAVLDVLPDVDGKRDMICAIERHIGPKVPIFTSALSICATKVASWLDKPDRVVGFQPWLPDKLHVMEVSRPLQAENDESFSDSLIFWKNHQKEVEIVDDTPGLVFPRVLAMIVNEAAFALMEGVASVADIDLAMKLGTNYPMGPLAWADEIGLNEILQVLTGLHQELGDDRYRPASILRKYVYAGWIGQEAGRGFYSYE